MMPMAEALKLYSSTMGPLARTREDGSLIPVEEYTPAQVYMRFLMAVRDRVGGEVLRDEGYPVDDYLVDMIRPETDKVALYAEITRFIDDCLFTWATASAPPEGRFAEVREFVASAQYALGICCVADTCILLAQGIERGVLGARPIPLNAKVSVN
jgi:hypothetical protein